MIWLLKLNVNKCKSVSYGRCIEYPSEYTVSDTVIDKVDKIKDLGIVFDCRLKFGEHIDGVRSITEKTSFFEERRLSSKKFCVYYTIIM